MPKSTNEERKYISGLKRSDQMIIVKAYTEKPLVDMSETEQFQWEHNTVIDCARDYRSSYIQHLNRIVSSGIVQLTKMSAITSLDIISKKAIEHSKTVIEDLVSIKSTRMLEGFKDRIYFMKDIIDCEDINYLYGIFVHPSSIDVTPNLNTDGYNKIHHDKEYVKFIQEQVTDAIIELSLMDEFITLKKIAVDAIKSSMIAEFITDDVSISAHRKWKHFILGLNNPQCNRLMTKKALFKYPVLINCDHVNSSTMYEIKDIWDKMRPGMEFDSYWFAIYENFNWITDAVIKGNISIEGNTSTGIKIHIKGVGHIADTFFKWDVLDKN